MFLNRSFPNPELSLRSRLDLSSLSSGIIGGGGPISFFSSVGDARLTPPRLLSLLRSLLNQPLDRFALRPSTTLAPPRLCGRIASAPSPSAYALLRRFRLNSRRILPGRLDSVGDAGLSSAGRLIPDTDTPEIADFGEAGSVVPFAARRPFFVSCFSPFGVSGGVGTVLSTGEGGGGGMSVPSVSEPNLKSRTGSSKRLAGTVPVGFAVVEFVLDGMIAVWWARRGVVWASGRCRGRTRGN